MSANAAQSSHRSALPGSAGVPPAWGSHTCQTPVAHTCRRLACVRFLPATPCHSEWSWAFGPPKGMNVRCRQGVRGTSTHRPTPHFRQSAARNPALFFKAFETDSRRKHRGILGAMSLLVKTYYVSIVANQSRTLYARVPGTGARFPRTE